MRAALAFLSRWAPLVLAALLAAGLAVSPVLPLQLPVALLLFATATRGELRLAVGGAIAAVLSIGLHAPLWGHGDGLSDAVGAALVSATAVTWGAFRAQRRAATAREAELRAERAVAEERLRLARELHDAVGHDVSLMVVQAQALGATEPRVAEATDRIADLGRRTMRELHRTLALLREDGETSPAPGLEALGDVVAGARAAGVDLVLAVEGAPRALAPALDASAFRIVQESVTNVVRHAGCVPAAVRVRYGERAVELEISDRGPGRATGAPEGHGLVGMRERAALFGGTLEVESGVGEGFRVRGVLPYEAP